jgi:hypothetical protein
MFMFYWEALTNRAKKRQVAKPTPAVTSEDFDLF